MHRGATLPLDDHSLVIGASEDADVVLLDPGIETHHADLRLTGAGWALSSRDGNVQGADTNQRLDSVDLAPGELARLGHVWVTVVESAAPWTDPPTEPIDIEPAELEPDADVNAPVDDMGNEEQVDNPPVHEEPAPTATATVDIDAGGACQDISTDAVVQTGPLKRKWSKLQVLCAGLAGLVLLSACAAYGIVGGAAKSAQAKPVFIGLDDKAATKAGANGSDARGDAGSVTPGKMLLPEELRTAFRKRLVEVDLLKRFDLDLRDGSWKMQAVLDDEEAARFERTLVGFVHLHKITFPIQAKVGSAEHMLPFKIRQVISGTNASVVTLEGNRLYVGDEYQGVRLVSIQGSRLTFAGKRKIEVKW